MLYSWNYTQNADGAEWLLRRNCMLTPLQLGWLMATAGLLSLGVAIVWAVLGVWWILPFAMIEAVGLGIAFVVYGRHAADMDRVVVGKTKVLIEVVDGAKREQAECLANQVRVIYSKRKKSLIQLRMGAKNWPVGRFVPDSQRESLAKEFAKALGVSLQAI